MPNDLTARSSLTAIGAGADIVGMSFIAAGAEGRHPLMFLAGQILIAASLILLVIRILRARQS